MPIAIIPVLAQAFALSVGDRTELRLVIEGDQTIPEAQTTPYVAATVAGRRSDVSLSYSPSFTLTPLDSPDRELLIFHGASAVGTMRFRRTTVTLLQTGGYGEQNFRVSALASSAPPGAQPGTTPTPPSATTGQARALRRTVDYATARSALSVSRQSSRKSLFGGVLGYELAGGTDRESRRFYPRSHGPDAAASYGYRLSPRDQLNTVARAEVTWTEFITAEGEPAPATPTGSAVTIGVEQGYSHAFNDYFKAGVSAGIAYTRIEERDGSYTDRLYPTFGLGSGAGLRYETMIAGGQLALTAGATYSPVLDTVRAVLDPRIATSVGARYTRQRLGLYVNGSTIVSLTPEDEGALSGITASTGAVYDLGAGFAVDGGARAAWQSFEGTDVVPPIYALFVGLSWGATVIQSSGQRAAPRAATGNAQSGALGTPAANAPRNVP